MIKMKNIKGQPTLALDANDLNIVMSCPHCNAKNDRIIHGKKKWKCLNCFKSFKTPNVGKNSSNVQNIKTFNDTETKLPISPTSPTSLVDIVPDPELVEFLDKLPNGGVPSFDKSHIDEADSLITNSKEIENFINTEKNEIALQRQEENEPISSNNSEIFIKSDLPSMIELSDKLKTIETLETTETPKADKKRKIIRRINHERQM